MTAQTFPRTQHWTTAKDGFRVTVMVYKTMRHERCRTCRKPGAIHSVWADGRGLRAGFTGGPEHFCDAHRPAKGTLPDLDYKRLVQGANINAAGEATQPLVYERLAPFPAHACAECGDPALFQVTEHCPGCDNPAQAYTSGLIRITAEGVQDGGITTHHRLHPTREWWACAAHSLSTLAEAS